MPAAALLCRQSAESSFRFSLHVEGMSQVVMMLSSREEWMRSEISSRARTSCHSLQSSLMASM